MLPISCRCRRRDSCRILIALCLLLAPAHAGKRLLPNLSPRGSRAPVEAAQRLAKAKLEAAQARVRAAEEELASVQRARAGRGGQMNEAHVQIKREIAEGIGQKESC